jgi:hypothetical protein
MNNDLNAECYNFSLLNSPFIKKILKLSSILEPPLSRTQTLRGHAV